MHWSPARAAILQAGSVDKTAERRGRAYRMPMCVPAHSLDMLRASIIFRHPETDPASVLSAATSQRITATRHNRVRFGFREGFGSHMSNQLLNAGLPLKLAAAALLLALASSAALAKLPPPTDEAKAVAAEAAAKSAWADKVGLFQLCNAMTRVANTYRERSTAAGKVVPPAVPTPECAHPGDYAPPATPSTSKPIEAAGAHSPPGTAVSPPSTKASAADIAKRAKK